MTDMNVMARLFVEFADKKLIFAVFERLLLPWLLKLRETDSSFVLIVSLYAVCCHAQHAGSGLRNHKPLTPLDSH